MHENHLGVMKHRLLGPNPNVGFIRLRDQGICISNQFPGAAAAAGPRTRL